MPLEHTAWITWHEDPVQVISGGNEANGTYWHPTTPGAHPASSGLLMNPSHNRASFRYDRAFAGPYPSDDPLCSLHRATRLGHTGTDEWPGTCPAFAIGTFTNSGAGGNSEGSFWEVSNGARIGPGGGIQQVNTITDLTGWQLQPWRLYGDFDRWMNDPALEAEWSAAVEATRPPGEGWFVEDESQHPYLLLLEWAPDEPWDTATAGDYQDAVKWLTNPTGWGYYSQPGAEPEWFGGAFPAGTEIAVYDGGSIDFTPVPPEWMPTQLEDPFFVVFESPEEDTPEWWDATIVLTLAHIGITDASGVFAGAEGTVVGKARYHQVLAFRASWRLPQFRWTREAPEGPPAKVRKLDRRDEFGFTTATRIIGGHETNRLVGNAP